MIILKELDAAAIPSLRSRPDADPATEATVRAIIEDVRSRGEAAVRGYAERFGDIGPGQDLYVPGSALLAAADALPAATRDMLERCVARVRAFAEAQRASLAGFSFPVPGGKAGQSIAPVSRAGCYVPGGRYPLPSSAIMTVATARAAGVADVIAASPNPSAATLAAAGIAGADGLLRAGGAHAIAAFAYGCGTFAPRDLIAGPGNRYVTAAKRLVSGTAGIDMLAGPSELVVIADSGADPRTVAFDLLAQAEHDPDAVPVLVALSREVAEAVDAALEAALPGLPSGEIALRALANGGAFVVGTLEEAAAIANALAPEHLELSIENAAAHSRLFTDFGAAFVGYGSAEVFGDYCFGPNHVLPTGGASRFSGGLSVFAFLRIRTWMEIDGAAPGGDEAFPDACRDAIALARIEGLEGHARAAEARATIPGS